MESTLKSIEPRASSTNSQPVPVTIIGAGPYGLSIAAHLRALGVRFRIFGKAMESWSALMPKGMCVCVICSTKEGSSKLRRGLDAPCRVQ